MANQPLTGKKKKEFLLLLFFSHFFSLFLFLSKKGTWGKETFQTIIPPPLQSTTTAEIFDMTPKQLTNDMEKNKFAKFVSYFSISLF